MPLKKSTPPPSPISTEREVSTSKPSVIAASPDKRHPGNASSGAPADCLMGPAVEPAAHFQTAQHIADSDQQAGETNSLNDNDERALEKKISALWSCHSLTKSEGAKNREQMRVIRVDLGRELAAYKKVLARPGCGGNWAGFLREHKIPRATADRYVQRWEDAQNPAANRLTEALDPPSADQIAVLVKKTTDKLMNLLPTQACRTEFLEALTLAFREAPPLVTT